MNYNKFLNILKNKGIGERTLKKVKEAIEEYESQPSLTQSQIVRDYFLGKVQDGLREEGIWVILLDVKLNPIDLIQVSMGNSFEATFNRRRFVRSIVECDATRCVLVHNHPSGDPSPSNQDHRLTAMISELCETVETKLIDHLIIASHSYYSFADKGTLI